jgi:hypothetical protein
LTEDVEVQAESSPADWFNIGAAPANVQLPDDGYTTRIVSNLGTDVHQYTLQGNTIPAGSTVNSVTLHFRAIGVTGGGSIRPRLYLAGNYADGADTPVSDAGFADYEVTIARPGGGAWSMADLTALEAALRNLTAGDYTSVTTVYAIIDYTPGAPSAAGDMLLVF